MEEPVPCAVCLRPVGPGTGYVVRIDVFADPRLPAVSAEQLESTHFGAAIDELLEQMKQMTADELQDDVHRRFEYRLCGACQRQYLANPLGMPRKVPVGKN